MKLLSLEPFIPSGDDFDKSKQLFLALGFSIDWDAGDYVGFNRDGCKFILQNFNNAEFAQNLMINVRVNDADEFWKFVNENKLTERFGIRMTAPRQQPYGKEVNVIDIAGVCWHFVQ
jgi:hypothetical protein